jgi:hypothetical protein
MAKCHKLSKSRFTIRTALEDNPLSLMLSFRIILKAFSVKIPKRGNYQNRSQNSNPTQLEVDVLKKIYKGTIEGNVIHLDENSCVP